VFEVKADLVKVAAGKIKRIMESVINLKTPIVVDAKAGENWEEMKII